MLQTLALDRLESPRDLLEIAKRTQLASTLKTACAIALFIGSILIIPLFPVPLNYLLFLALCSLSLYLFGSSLQMCTQLAEKHKWHHIFLDKQQSVQQSIIDYERFDFGKCKEILKSQRALCEKNRDQNGKLPPETKQKLNEITTIEVRIAELETYWQQ